MNQRKRPAPAPPGRCSVTRETPCGDEQLKAKQAAVRNGRKPSAPQGK